MRRRTYMSTLALGALAVSACVSEGDPEVAVPATAAGDVGAPAGVATEERGGSGADSSEVRVQTQAPSDQNAGVSAKPDDRIAEAEFQATEPVPLSPERDLWQAYGAALESGREVESFGSLDELARSADQITIGKISDVTVGRLVQLADAPSSGVQFVVYWVEPTRPAAAAIAFELPIVVSSPELDEAVQAAVAPIDLNDDGVLSDEELANSYDAAAVADAYEKYWDSAVDYSLAEVKRRVPGVESVFLLRAVPTEGKYRPINGDAIIVNDAGQARAPWREAGHDSPIAAEISSMSFEQVVEAVSVPTR